MIHRLRLVSFVLACGTPAALASDDLFPIPGLPTPGGGPVLLDDFNGDGHLDVAGVAKNPSRAFVHLADGKGALLPAISTPLIDDPGRLAADDLDGDGRAEMLVGHGSQFAPPPFSVEVVEWVPGDILTSVVTGTTQHGLQLVLLGDVDGDGDSDILYRTYNGGATQVRSNLGGVTFGPPVALIGPGAFSYEGTDMDLDGDLDLFGVGFGGLVKLYENTGGAYPVETVLPLPIVGLPVAPQVADVTGDGIPDVVTMGDGNGYVFPGLGGFAFGAPIVFPSSVGSFSLADIDADGHLDIALPTSDQTIHVLLNQGNGVFGPTTVDPVASLFASVGDVTGDGRADVVSAVGEGDHARVFVVKGKPNGRFESGMVETASFDPLDYPYLAVAGDFNGDGLIDMSGSVLSGVNVYRGLGGGGFQSNPVASYGDDYGVLGMAAADFNGDGAADLLVREYPPLGFPLPGPGFYLALSPGNQTFAPSLSPLVPLYGYGYAIDDIDVDGDLDVVGTRTTASHLAGFVLNDGNGTFSAPTTLGTVSTNATGLALTDFDNDGRPDLIVGNVDPGGGPGAVQVYKGTPGSFGPAITSVGGVGDPFDLRLGDFNGDGRMDVLASEPAGAQLGDPDFNHALLIAQPNQTFALTQTLVSGTSGAATIDVGDLDLDGLDDLVTSGPVGVHSLVFLGRPNGTLEEHGAYGVRAGRLVDLDGDGYPDLLDTRTVAFNRVTDPFCDLGYGLPGTFGSPVISGDGSLATGGPFGITVEGGLPGAPMAVVVGTSAGFVGTLGSILVPNPTLVVPAVLDANGALSLSANLPPIAPGLSLWMQCLVADGGALFGVAFSNAIQTSS